MSYQRDIPPEELFSAQLELLMQNGQLATVAANLIAVGAAIIMFWPFVGISVVLLWAAAFLILLLLRSLHMSNALAGHAYRDKPRRVYMWLLIGSSATGVAWAGLYIFASKYVPITTQYTFLLLLLMITAISVGFAVIIREYFMVYLFGAIWPIAWWSLAYHWQQPFNLVIGLSLLAFCAVMIVICERIHLSYCNMIGLAWEREYMSRDLGDLTHSLRERNRELTRARRRLTDLANIDELTGVGNRRMVNAALHEALEQARRNGSSLSVILLDVDYFKLYNDAYGHPAGDRVLQALAAVMQRVTSREGEVVGRWGGEEFILVLPGAAADAAQRTAERVRALVEAEAIPHAGSDVAGVVTVSQGVAGLAFHGEQSGERLVALADEALYLAKQQGRNRVVVAGKPAPDTAAVVTLCS